MINYIPFLKFKVNEIGALSSLDASIQGKTYPFLDLPKKDGMSEHGFLELLRKARVASDRHLKNFPAYFLDNYDIDDSLKIAGKENYAAVIDAFGDSKKFVPLIGLDRPPARNELVFKGKEDGKIASSTLAIRLQADDFLSFSVIEDELEELQRRGAKLFSHWTMVLDNRMCSNVNLVGRSAQLSNFLANAAGKLQINAVIVAGSSIPASISELIKVSTEVHHPRREIEIFRGLAAKPVALPLFFGDYTVVSPLYSDIDIPPEAMQNVIAAKTIYSHGDVHYIVRGGALKTHPRARLQYNDIAGRIVGQPFYRGASYSAGDLFLEQKISVCGKISHSRKYIKADDQCSYYFHVHKLRFIEPRSDNFSPMNFRSSPSERDDAIKDMS